MPRMENTRPAGTMMENSWTSWSASRRHACNNAREINQSEYIDIFVQANSFLGSFDRHEKSFFFFFDKSVHPVTRFVTTHLSSTYTYISIPSISPRITRQVGREANWIRRKGKLLSTGVGGKKGRRKGEVYFTATTR